MRKKLLLLCAAISLISFSAMAQTPEPDEKFIYCELLGTGKLLSSKVTVEIDFGQASSAWKSNRLLDENGKAIVFNSMVDAMNYMGNDGWEFAQAYVVTVGQQNVYHWLLKKNIKHLTEEEKTALLESYKTSR